MMIQTGHLWEQLQIHLSIWSELDVGLVNFLWASCFKSWEGSEEIVSFFKLNHLILTSFLKLTVADFRSSSLHAEVMDCNSKEPLLKDLQAKAIHIFSIGKTCPRDLDKANAESDTRRRQQNKELMPSANLSPSARFLLSRFVKQRNFVACDCIESSISLDPNAFVYASLMRQRALIEWSNKCINRTRFLAQKTKGTYFRNLLSHHCFFFFYKLDLTNLFA